MPFPLESVLTLMIEGLQKYFRHLASAMYKSQALTEKLLNSLFFLYHEKRVPTSLG